MLLACWLIPRYTRRTSRDTHVGGEVIGQAVYPVHSYDIDPLYLKHNHDDIRFRIVHERLLCILYYVTECFVTSITLKRVANRESY